MSAPFESTTPEPPSIVTWVIIAISMLIGVWATIELIGLLPWFSRRDADWIVGISLVIYAPSTAVLTHRANRRSRP